MNDCLYTRYRHEALDFALVSAAPDRARIEEYAVMLGRVAELPPQKATG